MSGGSCAPIENSPPGIQAMPTGAASTGFPLFEIVGRNWAVDFIGIECAVVCALTVAANWLGLEMLVIVMSSRARIRKDPPARRSQSCARVVLFPGPSIRKPCRMLILAYELSAPLKRVGRTEVYIWICLSRRDFQNR